MNQYKTLSEALSDLENQGYTKSFGLKGDGLHCLETDEILRPKDITIVAYHRFEGISDPDDMEVIYVLETKSGLKGTIVDAYGAYSNAALSEFFEKVKLGP